MFYLRFLLTAFCFFGGSFLIVIFSFFKWRQPTNGHLFAQIFTKGADFVLPLKVIIHNESRLLSTQPCIYLANHQDTADLVILGHSYPANTAVIGKKELAWVPFFGQLFYVTGNILLHRKHHGRAMEQMSEALAYITEKKISVYMFPEGTRNKGAPQLLPFKKGAFHMAVAAQVPLLPIVAAPNRFTLDLKARKIRKGIAHIEVLDPIPTVGLTDDDVPNLIEIARSRMQEAFERLGKLEGKPRP